MSHSLDHLLIPVDKTDQIRLQATVQREFTTRYTTVGGGLLCLHDGTPCQFNSNQLNHAFRETNIGANGKQTKGLWSPSRIKRVAWIGVVIQGQAPTTACYDISAGAEPGWDQHRRVYIYGRYVVWVERTSMSAPFAFSTAYLVDDPRTLRKYSKYGRKLEVETPRDKAHGAKPVPNSEGAPGTVLEPQHLP